MNELVNEYKKYSGKRSAPLSKVSAALKNPLIHFVIFGVILIIFQVLCQAEVFKASWVIAVGRTMIYSMAALGFCLLLGYSGLASLGTSGFIGLAAYLAGTFLQSWGVSPLISLLLVAAVLTVVGCVVGFISLRIKGIFLAIITLGLSEILVALFIALDSWTGGQSGMRIDYPQLFGSLIGSGIQIQRSFAYYLITGALVILMAVTVNIINSPTGRAMLAMKNSTSAAQAFGISLFKYRLLAFVISTLYCAVAGFMYMMFIRSSNPGTWNLALSLNILGAVIVGGMKSVWGAIGGAFLFFGFDSLVLQNIPFFIQNPTFISLLIGVLTIIVVMFWPGGLPQIAAEIKRGVKKLIRKYKERKYGDEQI